MSGLPDNEPVNTVREDPERKGLLFAGTERTVYVSLDDGDHWQSLKLNLPPTSIRDLVVHKTTSSSALTDGRSGSSTTSRRCGSSARKLPDASAHLFAPQLTYRVRRNNNTDTPLPPEEPAGTESSRWRDDRLLAEGSAHSAVRSRWKSSMPPATVVRHFSSADKPEPVNPTRVQCSDVLGTSGANALDRTGHASLCLGSDLSRARRALTRLSRSPRSTTTRRAIRSVLPSCRAIHSQCSPSEERLTRSRSKSAWIRE